MGIYKPHFECTVDRSADALDKYYFRLPFPIVVLPKHRSCTTVGQVREIVRDLHSFREFVARYNACEDDKEPMCFLRNRKNWTGPWPHTISVSEVEYLRTGYLTPLINRENRALTALLCKNFPAHFEEWWDPENMPVSAYPLLRWACPGHRHIWEPYYASWMLMDPEGQCLDYPIEHHREVCTCLKVYNVARKAKKRR